MEIGNWESTQDLNGVLREIERLGLERHLHELDAYGFTVVENLIDPETVQTARQAICDICEQQTGRKPDLEKGEEHPNWRFVPYLMPRHEVFQDIMLNEKGLALISYLVGKSAQLFSMGCHFKGPGDGGQIPLHADAGLPLPLPSYAAICNINYALTDYTKEGGCLAIVPGSHKLCRPPNPEESWLDPERQNPNAVAMEGPGGNRGALAWEHLARLLSPADPGAAAEPGGALRAPVHEAAGALRHPSFRSRSSIAIRTTRAFGNWSDSTTATAGRKKARISSIR